MSEPTLESNAPLVMTVDDDPDALALAERWLSNAGYRTLTEQSGMRAIGILTRERPDLILLDVMMPGMTGHQVCALLQQDPDTAFIPVVFLTGLDDEQDKQAAFALGAADYLVKPVKKEALLEVVSRNLERKAHWYHVRIATDLWNERPLPEKFNEFRQLLLRRSTPSAEDAAAIESLRSNDVYALGRHLGMTETDLAAAMAAFFDLPLLERIEAQDLQLGVLPSAFSRTHQVVAIRGEQGENGFVITNPFVWGLEQLDTLNRAFKGANYRLYLTEQGVLNGLFYNEALTKGEATDLQAEMDERHLPEIPIESLPVTDNVSPVQVVKSLIADAVRKRASDIHIEPERGWIRIRYRIDGHMQYVVPLQSALLPGIVSRIKVQCGMDLSESRKPQDGGCRTRVDGKEIELRTSTLAGTHGEIVVLRILGESAGLYRLDSLGMDAPVLRDLRRLLVCRQGMILITGPTGSGKTTTLYASLNHLNTDDLNLLTVEDPVEADIAGVNQVQIHERAGRSFAATLRAMLRQDPDIIMVGEIRDLETAEIAARAALTGHLVLSTLHTRDTPSTVARLQDMGVPNYLTASSLLGIVAQRLVRRICDGCAQPYELPDSLREAFTLHFGSVEGATFQKGAGCARCNRTGMRGRVGVFELLAISEAERRLIADGAAVDELRQSAAQRGFRTLELDAFEKAKLGLIAPEEIMELGLGFSVELPAPEPGPSSLP